MPGDLERIGEHDKLKVSIRCCGQDGEPRRIPFRPSELKIAVHPLFRRVKARDRPNDRWLHEPSSLPPASPDVRSVPRAGQFCDELEARIARPCCRPSKAVEAVLIVQNALYPGLRQVLVEIPVCQKREHTVVDNAIEVDHRCVEEHAKHTRVEGSQPGSRRNVLLHGSGRL